MGSQRRCMSLRKEGCPLTRRCLMTRRHLILTKGEGFLSFRSRLSCSFMHELTDLNENLASSWYRYPGVGSSLSTLAFSTTDPVGVKELHTSSTTVLRLSAAS